jgi:hypothetical protein
MRRIERETNKKEQTEKNKRDKETKRRIER